jgi:uncharacterized UBP type Zn finger protein
MFHRNEPPMTRHFVATFRPDVPLNDFSRERAVLCFRIGGPTHQLRGLANIGSNCYVNAVFQALADAPGFPQFCQHLPNVLYQHNSSSTFCLDAVGHIFCELKSRRSISPALLLQDAGGLAECFRRPVLQDAHKFLLHPLEAFERECVVAGAGETIISHFFTCKRTVTLRCHGCGARTTRETRCHDIGVPMREFPGVAATEAITSSVEIAIPGQCEHCGRAETLAKSNQFTKLPLILIMTIMRFDSALKKIEDFLSFPKTLWIMNHF